jgi:hypothetical protein
MLNNDKGLTQHPFSKSGAFRPAPEVIAMFFLKNLLFRYSDRIIDYFSDAVRIYAFKEEEAARWAAVVAVKIGGKKQRKFMINHLAQMASNVLKNYPNKSARKSLSDRIVSLREEIESSNGNPRYVREAEEKLSKLNEEYLYSLRHGDALIFRRKHPKCF